MQLGLTPPRQLVNSGSVNIGGIMQARPLSSLLKDDATKSAAANAAEAANQPVVQGLVQMLKEHWSLAKSEKQEIEQGMLDAVRARAGRYPADMEARLESQGGSQIYMMLFATKARQAKALLSDVLVGSGAEKPWTMTPSPKPDIPSEMREQILLGITKDITKAEMLGQDMPVSVVQQLMRDGKEWAENQVMAQARSEAKMCETELEDVLVEGGFLEALDEFVDDLTTFKSAFIKGPIITMEPSLQWEKDMQGRSVPVVKTVKKLRFERVDPFMIYPLSWTRSVQEGSFFERHKLTRGSLSALIGVDGYSEDAIRAVLDEHGDKGLNNWLQVDTSKADAENRNTSNAARSDTIDALQYWGSVSGKMLKEWGMDTITDEAREYPVELWQIGEYVIKCVINPDPLARRPYYSDGYSRIPGAFWHNCLYDLIRDVCDMCNASARALANNMGLASGPQVGVNTDRLAPGEDVSEMYPWKIWQFNSDPMGSNAAPITFFQPSSNASELMGVYDKFSLMADEYSGIPRYMTGTEGTPGAGRTASGLSMMVGNASKVIKSLVGSIDIRVISPLLSRLFDWKIQYDEEFKYEYQGDLHIIARGAMSLQVKEAANTARLQWLQATANPLDMQITGVEGRAAVLREVAKGLGMNMDDVVPNISALRLKQIETQMAQQHLLEPRKKS